jgi:DNA-binding response OmpR family regulator
VRLEGDCVKIILIADDDPELRQVLVDTLADEDQKVFAAADGFEAIRILIDYHIDLLIAEVKMPGIDGFELARQAKVMRPLLHVIYISGYNFNKEKGAGRILGPILHKPIRSDDLRSRVRSELSR